MIFLSDRKHSKMSFHTFLFLSVQFAGNCFSAEKTIPQTDPAPESRYRKCISAPYVKGEVTIDGVPDESAWGKAFVFSDFLDAKTGKPAASRTEARIFHDENYLYLALKCFDKRSDITAANGHSYSLWGGDCVDMFLGGLDPEPYCVQFSWGPGSAVYGSGPHWESKSRVEDDYWTSETRIRLSALMVNSPVMGIHLARAVKKSGTNSWLCDVEKDYQSTWNYAELILGSYAQAARWKFHLECPDEISREEYEKINHQLTVPRYRIIRGPWLFDATENAMSIGWCTAGKTGSLLDYREKGEKEFKTLFSGCNDNRWDKDRRIHKVRMTGLKPGAVYEYRIKNMNRNEKDLVQYPADGGCYSFTVHGKKDLTFLAFVDVHGNGGIWGELIGSQIVQNCDLIVNIGDMITNGSGVPSIFLGYLDAQLSFASRKPLLNFRGNHEYRGSSPGTFDVVFGSPGWKGYSLHRFGDVCLIGLDAFNDTQGKWLKTAVETPAFRTAKHRIVVAHYPATMSRSRTAKDFYGIFTGEGRSADIDLYLCGHQHRGAFVAKNTEKYLRFDNRKSRKVEKLPFDLIVNEGPNTLDENTAMLVEAKGDSLTVKLLKPDGSVYRFFKIK